MTTAPLHRRRSAGRRHRWPVMAALLGGGLLIAGPAAGQVTANRQAQLDVQRRHREAQYRAMQNIVLNMQPLPDRRAAEVFLFRVRNRSLTVDTTLPEWHARRGGQFRVELDELPGPAYVRLANVPAFHRPGRAGAGDGVAPVGAMHLFDLVSCQMPTPGTLTTLNVRSSPDTFSLDWSEQFDGGHRQVRLIEQRDTDPFAAGGRDNSVQLWVNAYGGGRDGGGQGAPLNLRLAAVDFPALVRAHPQEVAAHLRPLLARLGQEQVFAPDPMIVRQVLPEHWPADPAVAGRITALLPALDHPNFRVREPAAAKVAALGEPGAAALLRMDRTRLSPTQNQLLDRALAPYRQLPPTEAAKLRDDPAFLADCLYSDDPPAREAALVRLRRVTARPNLRFAPPTDAPVERYAAARALREQLGLAGLTTQPAARPQPSPAVPPVPGTVPRSVPR